MESGIEMAAYGPIGGLAQDDEGYWRALLEQGEVARPLRRSSVGQEQPAAKSATPAEPPQETEAPPDGRSRIVDRFRSRYFVAFAAKVCGVGCGDCKVGNRRKGEGEER